MDCSNQRWRLSYYRLRDLVWVQFKSFRIGISIYWYFLYCDRINSPNWIQILSSCNQQHMQKYPQWCNLNQNRSIDWLHYLRPSFCAKSNQLRAWLVSSYFPNPNLHASWVSRWRNKCLVFLQLLWNYKSFFILVAFSTKRRWGYILGWWSYLRDWRRICWKLRLHSNSSYKF